MLRPDVVVIDEAALASLPSNHLHRMELKGKTVVIVGTAHVSHSSAALVTQVVDAVQPGVLLVELCPQRTSLLLPQAPPGEEAPQKSSLEQVKEVMAQRQGLSGAFQLALGYFYKKVGSEIKITPGAEFRAALEAVKRGRVPCQLILGDRAIGVTIQRAWALLPLWEKVKLMWQLVRAMFSKISKEDIERMKQSDVLTELMIEFCEYFPSLSRVLLLERDLYLARSLYNATRLSERQQFDDEGEKEEEQPERREPMGSERIVAVVGLGHVKGMVEALERWKRGDSTPEVECVDLTFVPPTSWTARRMGLLFLVALIAVGVLAFFGIRHLIRLIW
jgi:pheromone shutdown protein TraB